MPASVEDLGLGSTERRVRVGRKDVRGPRALSADRTIQGPCTAAHVTWVDNQIAVSRIHHRELWYFNISTLN